MVCLILPVKTLVYVCVLVSGFLFDVNFIVQNISYSFNMLHGGSIHFTHLPQ